MDEALAWGAEARKQVGFLCGYGYEGCTFKCSQLCVVESLLDFIDGLGFLLMFELSAYRTYFVLCHFGFFAMKINLFDFLYIKGKSTLYLLIFES